MKQKPGNPKQPMTLWHRLGAAFMRRVAGTITAVETSSNAVALTFDDGPNPQYTPLLLDLLARFDAKATFFLVGKAAQEHPELVKRMALEGHAIGNHSWDHVSFPFISSRARKNQIEACAKALAPFGEKLFRPPFGHLNLKARITPWLMGYEVVAWNATGVDWSGESEQQILDNLEPQIKPGCIVLLHDSLFANKNQSYCDRQATLRAVERLLEKRSSDTRFVTVPKLLQLGKPVKQNWRLMPDAAWIESRGLA